MQTILAHITARPDTAAEMARVLANLAVASRKDLGCQRYSVYQEATVPTQFVTFEEWEDQVSIAAHMKAPHVTAVLAGVRAGRCGARNSSLELAGLSHATVTIPPAQQVQP